MKWKISILVLLSTLLMAFHTYSATNTAFNVAKIEGKKLIYIFELKTCPYCKMFNLKTLSDPLVQKVLDINYRVVIVYYDEHPKMFYKFGIRGTPTLWFFDTTKEKPKPITYLPGFVPPDMFVKVLRYVYKLPKEPFKEYIKKKDDFLGERKLLKISQKEAVYILENDPDSVKAESMKDFKGEDKVYVTSNEKLAKALVKKAYRVLLVVKKD